MCNPDVGTVSPMQASWIGGIAFHLQSGSNEKYDTILKDEEIIDWEVDYGDSENFSSIKFSSQINIKGILLMIINDREGIFYPILQMNLD